MNFDYIKHHIALLAVVALLIFGGVYGIESLIEKHDAESASKYTQILQEQQKQTAVLQAELEERETAWQAQNEAALATIQKLSAGITQRNQQLTQTKQQNASLSATQLADKVSLYTESPVTAANDTLILPLSAAVRIVDRFDEYQTLSLNYADSQMQLNEEKTIAANLQSDLNVTKDVVAAKDKVILDLNKKYDADTATLKADARKGKLKWAIIGAIGGSIAKALLGF